MQNISRLERVRNKKFATDVSNKKLLNPAKYQDYCSYRFWFIKEKKEVKVTPYHPD